MLICPGETAVCCPSGILADRRYVRQVAGQSVRAELRSVDAGPTGYILRFYSYLSVPIERKRNEVRRQGVLPALDQLKALGSGPGSRGPPCTVNPNVQMRTSAGAHGDYLGLNEK